MRKKATGWVSFSESSSTDLSKEITRIIQGSLYHASPTKTTLIKAHMFFLDDATLVTAEHPFFVGKWKNVRETNPQNFGNSQSLDSDLDSTKWAPENQLSVVL